MKNKSYSFVGDTTYSLLLYLLYCSDEMLQNTTFYVGRNLAPCVLPYKVIMPPLADFSDITRLKYRLRCLKYRKKLSKSFIYAQDHLYFSAPLIDNLEYSVLEDCPNFFTAFNNHVEKKFRFTPSIGAYWYNFKVGRINGRHAGYNPWCIKRIVTTNSDKLLFDKLGLDCEQIHLQKLWNTSSSFKQEFIKNVYSLKIGKDLLVKQVALFSQPLMEDAHMSTDEVIAIYKPYIDKYGADNVLVKLHPRDKFDYKKYFPGIATLQTKAPQQLLSVMGIKFKTAITICSTAVSAMGKDCEIVWIGADVDKRILDAYGYVRKPDQY